MLGFCTADIRGITCGITARPGVFKHNAACWLIPFTSDKTVGTLVWSEKIKNNSSFRGVIKTAAIFKRLQSLLSVFVNKQEE